MQNKTKKILFLLSAFLMVPNFVSAAPAISGVAGTIANGQTLTINGSGLSSQDTTNWTVSEAAGGFELGAVGGYVGNYVSLDGWQPYGGGGSPVFYDNTEKILGNQSMRGDVIGTGKMGAVTARTYNYDNPDMYFRYYFKYPVGYDWPNNYHKQAIIGAAYIQPLKPFNPIKYYVTGNPGDYSNHTTIPSSLYGGELKDGRWYCLEVRRRQGSSFNPRSLDSQTQAWIDGVEISNFSDTINDQNQGWGGFQLGMINGEVFTDANSSFWIDGAMVSKSRIYPAAMVEIANSTNYATALKVKQPLQHISDNQIKITADLSALGSGPYYVFVTNNRQEKSIAYALGGSGGGDTTPPTISNPQPSATLSAGTTSINMQVTTHEPATCKYATTNISYGSMPNTFVTTNGTTHTKNLTGLTNGSSTTYYVRCSDNSNNANVASTAITVSVANNAPVNGSCGSASGQSFDSLTATSANLCSGGNVASFSGSGPWIWGCSGINGGTSTSVTACSASKTAAPLNALFTESFNDNNYTSRSWYDGTTHGILETSGCQAGNCLKWSWAAGEAKPTNGGSMRKKFTPTDKLYVSFYTKFQSGWRGSGKDYHPHMLNILSNLDSDYCSLAGNYLNTYVEFLSDTTSPYSIRPALALQDTLRTNTALGTLPNDLVNTTENRSVNHCNGYKTNQDRGQVQTCYNAGGGYWYSATNWKNANMNVSPNAWHKVEVYFQMNSISNNVGQADGVMQEWIDGVKVIDHNNIIYRTNQDATKKWAQFVLAPYIGDGSPLAQTMWIDELTVASSLPGGSLDTTPPAIPTGLGVQ